MSLGINLFRLLSHAVRRAQIAQSGFTGVVHIMKQNAARPPTNERALACVMQIRTIDVDLCCERERADAAQWLDQFGGCRKT